MALLKHLNSERISFLPNRAIFQGVDNAPPSPENFKGTEKQSQQDAVNEVAAQSPSQIASAAMSRGSAIHTKYVQNTQALAAIINGPIASEPNHSNEQKN
jgi:hypothetical protein